MVNKTNPEELMHVDLELDEQDALAWELSTPVPQTSESWDGEKSMFQTEQKSESTDTLQQWDNFDLWAVDKGIKQREQAKEEEAAPDALIDFSYHKEEKKEPDAPWYLKLWNVFKRLAVLLLLVVVGLGAYYTYLRYATKPSPTESNTNYVQTMRDLRTKINPYIAIDHTVDYQDATIIKDFHTIFDAEDIGYIDKKYLLNEKMQSFVQTLQAEKNIYENNQNNITKYAYLPKEIANIVGEDDTINSIGDSLFALESIKFSSAVSVFMHLDSFIKNLSKSVGMSSAAIKEHIAYVNEKWGKDINLYIQKCYLNPFETNYDCNVIGDYDRYSRLFNEETTKEQERNFFKKLMYYIDLKLERTEFPSFNIVFQKFDKNNEKITFTIDINTLKQDELELSKSGILDDPVIFIMDKLVNNLKRSRFIKGNEIKIPSLKSQSKKIKVGITEFLVNTISRSFELPVQKNAEREIYDFVDQEI